MRIYAKKLSNMEIKRDFHLKKLIDSKHNGMIKVVTGGVTVPVPSVTSSFLWKTTQLYNYSTKNEQIS